MEKGHIKIISFLARRLPLGLIEDQCSVQFPGRVCANFHSTVSVAVHCFRFKVFEDTVAVSSCKSFGIPDHSRSPSDHGFLTIDAEHLLDK